jgi:hypothetical protein
VVVFLGFALLLAFLGPSRRKRMAAVSMTRSVLAALSPRMAARGSGMLAAFLDGLQVSSPRRIWLFLGLTGAYRGLNAFGIALLARTLGLVLSPVAACTVLGTVVIGVMLPAGPGSVGTFQAAALLGLSLFTS